MSDTSKDEVITGEVVGDDSIDTRAGALRYAALKALESGVKAEIAELSTALMREGRRLGVSSFASDLGKITLASRKPTFSVENEVEYIQHFRDSGSGELIQEYQEPDPSKVAEVLAVLQEHAPHLVRTVEYVPEFLEMAFTNSLEMRESKGVRPILDESGEAIVVEEVNPLTGEVEESPAVEEFSEVFVVQRVKSPVTQDDGSIVEQVEDVRLDFMSVTPGTAYLSYPASKEQKVAKAQAAAFFSEGDLTITRQIPRKPVAAPAAKAAPAAVDSSAEKSAPAAVDSSAEKSAPAKKAPTKAKEAAPEAKTPVRRGAKRVDPVAEPTAEVVADAAPKRRAHRRG